METSKIINVVVGLVLILAGAFATFKPSLNYQKASTSDILAIAGIILMIIGVVLLFSPFIK